MNKSDAPKNLLKNLNILYVEDDENIKYELSNLLKNFVNHIYTASDGQEGYEVFLNNQSKIDVIISDINMPKLSGIEMMQEIRKINKEIPVIFATAYSDSAFLAEAIKVKVYDYIVKPINIRTLLIILNEIAYLQFQERLIVAQRLDLQRYKEILENNNLIIKIDLKGTILYINQLFLEISSYEYDEIVNQNIQKIVHKENQDIINTILSTINKNNSWKGNIKNINKFQDDFIVEAIAIPNITENGEILGAILVQKDITAQIIQKREIQSALMKAKSKVFLEGKETISELNSIINEQSKQIDELSELLNKAQIDKSKIFALYNRSQLEIKSLKSDLIALKNQPQPSDYQASSMLKLSKENLELKNSVAKLEVEKNKLLKDLESDIFKEKIALEVMIDDLESELSEYKEKLETFENKDALDELLDSYKQKAIQDEKRLKFLEAKIIRHCDNETASIIFTDERSKDR
ncbi:MAG: response regulator [Arcobacter butzleri]|jgi:PAS domain S-box-containing protein|nr:response regulator [Arcobacteraceae bacterium]MDY0364806.1 response regulator [Arcobacteraceae bacterium]NLO16846.1 response regulator [Aliarcobacter butzleri]